MSARAVAAWALAAVTVALVTTSPVYRALVALVAINVLLRHRLPDRDLRPLLTGVGIAMLSSVALNLVLAHTGRHVLLVVPGGVPAVGGPVTLESAVFGSVTALGVAAAVLACAGLSLLAEPEDLVDALPPLLERTGTAVGAALALAPAIGRSYRSVREAQLARGWRPRGPRAWSELLVPVVLTAVEDSVQVAEAMEARAFGSGPRTRLRRRRLDAAGAAVVACAALAAALMLAGRATGRLADWYPYPSVTVPAVDPLAVAACLLLAAPLVPWPGRATPRAAP